MQIRIVKSKLFMISKKGQAILITQKQRQIILGEPQHNIPSSQFQIYCFRNPYRVDRNHRGGGVLLFVRESLITRLSSRHSFPHDIEILLKLNLRKNKWLICCCYSPHKNLINYHLQKLAIGIQIYSNNYNEILLMGDFNAEVSSFCELYEVNSIIN